MIPFRLLFQPGGIFNKYPRRDWRRISLWLKWGLLFSFFGVLFKIFIAADPASASYIISFLEYLAVEGEFEIPRFIILSLFAITKATYLVLLWVFRGLIIFIGIKIVGKSFVEFPVALSISGAGMVTGIWYCLPYGYLFYFVHGVFLSTFLLTKINRLENYQAIITAIIITVFPLLI